MNTTHTIKIRTWVNGILEVNEIRESFATLVAARSYAQMFSNKSHHLKYTLKIYNYLGETVYTGSGNAALARETYA